MQEYYKILNISENATNEEVEASYRALKEKYSKERFEEGQVGNEAAKQLTKIETAYYEIMSARKMKSDEEKKSPMDYSEVERLIRKDDIAGAQQKLDDITDRDAEWHYLQSVIFYKKNWSNESKKQLEIALNMEPHNEKYGNAYTKLKQKMEYNDRQYTSGNANFNNSNGYNNQQQMGGSDMNNCCSFCATWCCVDMMCSMCCR
jgi:DnaJ-class molecular chaperone